MIADHAGSGKTLAYLAPLAQRLMEQERMLDSRPPKTPRVLVVTPTAELSAQVQRVARALAKGIPFRSFPITGARTSLTCLAASNASRAYPLAPYLPCGRLVHALHAFPARQSCTRHGEAFAGSLYHGSRRVRRCCKLQECLHA